MKTIIDRQEINIKGGLVVIIGIDLILVGIYLLKLIIVG